MGPKKPSTGSKRKPSEEIPVVAPKKSKVGASEKKKKLISKKKAESAKQLPVTSSPSRQVKEDKFVAEPSREWIAGQVLTLGQGDVGQLGLGEDVMERARPAVVPGLTDIVDICAGGMHTLGLNKQGEVISFGCNDEGALGRSTSVEGSETRPGKVTLPGKVVQISAGDSHSAALLDDGRVFAWGAFRDSHGTMGLTTEGVVNEPMQMKIDDKVMMIASGTDHLLMLTRGGQLFTCGCGEQGQLGRLPERQAGRECRQGLSQQLVPERVRCRVNMKFDKVWAGGYCTYARVVNTGRVYVFGLNNYKQLGIDSNGANAHFFPALSEAFSKHFWSKITGGQHHAIALDKMGAVFALGRQEYGRLGLGEDSQDKDVPTVIPTLADKKCVDVSCGTCVSFAITDTGEAYAWGMGTNGQLGNGQEDDVNIPTKMSGAQLEKRKVIAVSGGGQHTVLLAVDTVAEAMDQS